jgi:hypothetical protein
LQKGVWLDCFILSLRPELGIKRFFLELAAWSAACAFFTAKLTTLCILFWVFGQRLCFSFCLL